MEFNQDWVRISGDVEILERPDQQTFERYLAAGTPVILRGTSLDTAPCRNWTAAYFKERLGNHMVSVRISRDGTFKGGMGPYPEDMLRQLDMPFTEMMERMEGMGGYQPILCEGEKCYLYQLPLSAIEPIRSDIATPQFIESDAYGETIYRIWMGVAGNITPAHTDGWVDNLLFQVSGEKTVLLWDPSQVAELYIRPFGEQHSRESPVDMFKPQPEQYPNFAHASALRAELCPGDLLLIPQAWIHYVYTDTAAINLSYWFNTQEKLQNSLAVIGEWLHMAPPHLKKCYLHLLRWPESMLSERA